MIRTTSQSLAHPNNSERGSLMAFAAIIIIAALTIISFMVNLGTQQIMAKQLQTAVEASALAGAEVMDGTPASWLRAKRVALETIRNHRIQGADEIPADLQLGIAVDGRNPDPVDVFHTGSFGRAGNLDIIIERGFYRFNGDSNEFEFASLEGDGATNPDGVFSGEVRSFAVGADVSGIPDIQVDVNKKVPAVHGLPSYMVANALRVTLRLSDVSTVMGNLLGATSFNTMERSSVAVADEKLEECIAPLAIPACALLLNTNDIDPTQDTPTHTMDGYNPDMACERELLFTEADVESEQRIQGYTRASLYPRPPYVDQVDPNTPPPFPANPGDPVPRLNRKALPIRGVLGLPAFGTQVSAADISAAAITGCTPARIGDRFHPVDEAVDAAGNPIGFFDDPNVETALATLINGGEAFKDPNVFGDPTTATPSANRNYPFPRMARSGHPNARNFFAEYSTPFDPANPPPAFDPDNSDMIELMHVWPTDLGLSQTGDGSIQAGRILLRGGITPGHPKYQPNQYPALITDWTNPLCHSAAISGANDINNAKARRVKVAIIAPKNADTTDVFPTGTPPGDGIPDNGNPYCDWNNTFLGNQQAAFPPTEATEPIIVGFTEVLLFDFNVKKLDAPVPPHDGLDPNTPTFGTIQDQNPWMMEKTFKQEDSAVAMDKGWGLLNDLLNPAFDWERDCTKACTDAFSTTCNAPPYQEAHDRIVASGGTMSPSAACFRESSNTRPANMMPFYDYTGCFDFRSVSYYNKLLSPYLPPPGIPNVIPDFCRNPNTVPDPVINAVLLLVYDVINKTLQDAGQPICLPDDQVCLDTHLLTEWVEKLTDIQGGSSMVQNFLQAGALEPSFRLLELKMWIRGLDVPTTPDEKADRTMRCQNFAQMLDLVSWRDIEKTVKSDPLTWVQNLGVWGFFANTTFVPWDEAIANIADPRYEPSSDLAAAVTKSGSLGLSDYGQRHCMPIKRDDAFGLFDAESWEDPQPLQAQYGCGGIRARVTCGGLGSQSLFSGGPRARTKPALVE